MVLLPFAWMRASAALLQPLRRLSAMAWLREAQIDGLLQAMHPAWSLNRVLAQVEAREWVAEDMLVLSLRCNGNARGWQVGQYVPLFLQQDCVRWSRPSRLTDGRPAVLTPHAPLARREPAHPPARHEPQKTGPAHHVRRDPPAARSRAHRLDRARKGPCRRRRRRCLGCQRHFRWCSGDFLCGSLFYWIGENQKEKCQQTKEQ